jgi:hypothetical protein
MCCDSSLLPEAVTVETAGEIVYPNAFTPSTDGPNGGKYTKSSTNNLVFLSTNILIVIEFEFTNFFYNIF